MFSVVEATPGSACALGGDHPALASARSAQTANEVLAAAKAAGLPLADAIARDARDHAVAVVAGARSAIRLDVVIFDRDGTLVGRAGP